MGTVYIIDPSDNVGTALCSCMPGECADIHGDSTLEGIEISDRIRPEHKVALVDIPTGTNILKYGMPIGYATRDIKRGESVHLHNCASHYDARSNTLDADTGAPTDTDYA